MFKKEANLSDISLEDTQQTDSEVNSVLSAYKSEGDPALYEKAYGELKKFVESSLDIYKVSLHSTYSITIATRVFVGWNIKNLIMFAA